LTFDTAKRSDRLAVGDVPLPRVLEAKDHVFIPPAPRERD